MPTESLYKSALLFAVAGSFLAFAGVASAAPVITACVANLNGTARIVSSPAACILSVESAVQFNAQGVAGPVGATGTMGLQGVAGPTGPVGPAGHTGAIGAAGLGLNWRGAFSFAAIYKENDAVFSNGSSYVSLQNSNTGLTPPAGASNAFWSLIALDGATGSAGANGAMGVPGVPGAAGAKGAVGSIGPAGSVGSTGATGPAGPSGPTGPSGVSANQVYSATAVLPSPANGQYNTVPSGQGTFYYYSVPGGSLLVPQSCTASDFHVSVLGTTGTGTAVFVLSQSSAAYLLDNVAQELLACTVAASAGNLATCSSTQVGALTKNNFIQISAVAFTNTSSFAGARVYTSFTCQ